MNIKSIISEIDDEMKGTFETQETLEPNFWTLRKKTSTFNPKKTNGNCTRFL